MRNLKRALSLALATVMTMGMMVVGSSASYADVDSSYNQEAINVAQAVGIMTGDENGNFNPDNGVTRNEMAVIMCNLLDLKVGDSSSPFTDVASWAAPYVAACYNNGIVAGTSATTYSGDSTVTAAQAGLMVMKALGYFGYQGEFGQDWKVAVSKQANKIALFDDVKAYVDQALTRNEVAQIVLNALEADVMVVKEVGGVNVATGDVAVSVQATYTEDYVPLTDYNYDASNSNGRGTQQLCEKLYGRDLVKNAAGTDDMGRPTTNWTYLGTKVESTKTADATYTDAVALKTVYADLNLTSAKVVSVYLNGKDSGVYNTITLAEKNGGCINNAGTASYTNINAKNDDDGTKKIGGKGYTLEFFVDDDKNVTAVAYTEFLAKATADYNETNESVAIDVKTNGSALAGIAADVTELKSDDFEGLESIKKDDYLLITVAKEGSSYSVQSYSFPQIVSNVKVSGWKSGSTLVADGVTYKYDIYAVIDSNFLKDEAGMLDNSYDLYLNSNGYIIGADDSAESVALSNYVFIAAAQESSFNYVAKAKFMDGTSETITVNKVDSTEVKNATQITAGQFYTYTKRSDGKYDLKSVAATLQGSYAITATQEIAAGTLNPVGAGKVATGDTVYVHDGKVATGVKNAPSFKYKAADGAYDVYYLLDDSNTTLIKAIYSGTKGSSGSTADTEYVYVLGLDTNSIDSDGNNYYTYNAIRNGAKTTIDLSGTVATKGLYEITGYTDGYADVALIADNSYDSTITVAYDVANDTIDYNGGVVTVNGTGYTLKDEADVYLIDSVKDNKLSVIASSQLGSLATGHYSVYVILESDKTNASAQTIYVVRTDDHNP